MTPEQKAKELVEKMQACDGNNLPKWVAIGLARTCVDEIIAAAPSAHTLPDITSIYYDEFKEANRYWQQVKTEIQNYKP